MSWSSGLAVVALAGAVAGCRVEIGGAEDVDRIPAADTLRFACAEGPLLASDSVVPLAVPVERLLGAGRDLLAVTDAGELVLVPEGPAPPRPLLSGGKDYDARGSAVVRLSRESADFFRYEEGRLSALAGSVAVEPHDVSVALADGSIYLHSPANPSNVLVTARDRRTGGRTAGFLPVERSLLRLLLEDPDALLADLGRVRASEGVLAFVPEIHDPVVLVASRPQVLFLGDGERGSVRTVHREETRTERPCPTCTEHREIDTRQEFRRLYADAALAGGALWILRLSPPGSTRARLLRVGLEDPGRPEVRSWRLDDLDATPAALGFHRGRIGIADGRHLHLYPLPPPEGGAPCASR